MVIHTGHVTEYGKDVTAVALALDLIAFLLTVGYSLLINWLQHLVEAEVSLLYFTLHCGAGDIFYNVERPETFSHYRHIHLYSRPNMSSQTLTVVFFYGSQKSCRSLPQEGSVRDKICYQDWGLLIRNR